MLDQLVPSQRATLVTLTAPAAANCPPTKTLLPLAATVVTGPRTPPPKANQVPPADWAMLEARTPPAFVKLPATTRLAPLLTIPDTVAFALPVSPLPSADQFVPSHL